MILFNTSNGQVCMKWNCLAAHVMIATCPVIKKLINYVFMRLY